MKKYAFEIIKVLFIGIFALALLVCVLWGCMFTTDYIMYKKSRPTVFTKSQVEQTEKGKITYEKGAFYYVVIDEKEQRALYLFNSKID